MTSIYGAEVFVISEMKVYDGGGLIEKNIHVASNIEMAERFIWDYVNNARDYGDESKLICEISVRDADVRHYYKDEINRNLIYKVTKFIVDDES